MEISASYGGLLRRELEKDFFEKFIDILKKKLTEFFGEDEAERVMEALDTGRIEILNIENFLYSPWNVSDRTFEIYERSKSADEFFYNSLVHFKKLAEQGSTHIEIREFMFAFIDMLKKRKYNPSPEAIENYIKTFFYSLMNITHESPFYIQLLSPEFSTLLREKTGIGLRGYEKFIGTFFRTYRELPKHPFYGRDFLPHIEILYPVYPDVEWNQALFIGSIYGVERTHAAAIFKRFKNRETQEIDFDKVFERLDKETKKTIDRKSILLELNRIKEKNPVKMYPTAREFSTLFSQLGARKSDINLKEIKKTCVSKELFDNCLQPYFCHIEIDCSELKLEELNYYIDAAKTLSLARVYFYASHKSKYPQGSENFKITLRNIQDLSQNVVDFVKRKMKQLKSQTNRNFILDVCYDNARITQNWDKPEDIYIRVISDIHADYNQNRYSYNFGDDFIINCGDTAGDGPTCARWNGDHIKHGVIVAGNHLGYSKCFPDLDIMDEKNTKSFSINFVSKGLAGQRGVILMSNSVQEYEGVVILGTTLYTDFALYGEDHVEEAMQYAKEHMNDFKYITVPGHRVYTRVGNDVWSVKRIPREQSITRLFTPQDHAYYFHFSYNFLKEGVKEYRNKRIIIVTHHAPTPYAISPMYAGSMLNPAFASNLNEFIVNNPQIRLWCHGHVHNKSDIILGQTRVVCDPFGYDNENNADLPYNYGTRIKLSDIKSNKPWTDICSEEIKYGLIKIYER